MIVVLLLFHAWHTSLSLDQHFEARIVAKEPQVSLMLFDTSRTNDVSINELILNMVAEKSPAPSLQVSVCGFLILKLN